ncbi:MAG: Holliday junction branch migration protein RuvA [Patescibacteria group bacterium]
MIGSLKGIVTEVLPGSLLLEVNGVGYRVMASVSTLASCVSGEERCLYIHDHVREDSRDLYGFLTAPDLAMFERLINISGIGPKAGLTLLSVGSVETLRRAIMAGDIAMLTSVPGVGTKTAQKIVLELKGQLVDEPGESTEDRDVVEALMTLGYSSAQAREALKHVDAAVTDTSERIRVALKNLSKR